MRLGDHFCAPAEDWHTDALAYQILATNNHLDDLHPPSVEGNHLLEIVRVADGVRTSGKARVLFHPLLAYAYWLEQELRLEEALDTLETAVELSDGRAREEEIATHLQLGRVLRLSGRFDEARESYARGGELATTVGDAHSELQSRIGRAIVHQKLGNLPESERMLRAVLHESQELGDQDAEARSCNDLDVALHHMDRSAEAVPLAFQAFELYEHPTQRIKALSDTGQFLKQLGQYSAAKDALTMVLEANPPPEIRHRAAVELLELSALVQDQLSFGRWQRELDANYKSLPVDEQVEFEIISGAGLAAFDFSADAEEHLERAIVLSEQHGLGEQLFRAEAALKEVREYRAHPEGSAAPAREATPAPEVRHTIECLETLRAGE